MIVQKSHVESVEVTSIQHLFSFPIERFDAVLYPRIVQEVARYSKTANWLLESRQKAPSLG
jgi:hypothetical protein